jgi:hypothetical protein
MKNNLEPSIVMLIDYVDHFLSIECGPDDADGNSTFFRSDKLNVAYDSLIDAVDSVLVDFSDDAAKCKDINKSLLHFTIVVRRNTAVYPIYGIVFYDAENNEYLFVSLRSKVKFDKKTLKSLKQLVDETGCDDSEFRGYTLFDDALIDFEENSTR